MTDLTRRTTLRIVGTTALGLSLAGCAGSSGGSGGDSGGTGGSDGADDSGGSGDTGTTAASESGESGESSESSESGDSGGSGSVPSAVSEYLSDVGNYSGVTDETGADSVTVTVGAQGNGGNFAFDPPAVRVSTGTTVTWEWNGKGGSHNVVAEDGTFESELTSEEGHTFSHTFEEAGAYTYACVPHKTVGMKGAVVVE